MADYKPGDTAYVVENMMRVSECKVISNDGDSCIVVFPGGAASRLHRSRLYPTLELAEESIPHRETGQRAAEREYTPWG